MRAPTFERSLPALQERGGAIYLGGDARDDAGGERYLLGGLLPVVLLDGLAHAGNGLHAVARVEAGRVNLVLEPRAARQSRIARHRALEVHQYTVESGLRRRVAQTLLRGRSIERRLIVLRALLKPRERRL